MKRDENFRLKLLFAIVLPVTVSLSSLIISDYFLHLMTEGRLRLSYSFDLPVLRAHFVPAMVLSFVFITTTFLVSSRMFHFQLLAGLISLALAIIAIHLYVWWPELNGGRSRSTAIFGILLGIPIYGSIAAISAVIFASVISRATSLRHSHI